MLYSLFQSKNAPMIGLDIHSEEIRFLQLRREKEGIWVENAMIAELAAGAIIDGKIQSPLNLLATIEEVVRVTQTRGCSVAIAMPIRTVMLKRITLSETLSTAEWEAEISANLQVYFPGVTEALSFDFVIESATEVLLIAARQLQLDEYLTVVKQAGLKVNTVDVDAYAYIRGASFIDPQAKLMTVLDVDSVDLHCMVFQAGAMIFSHTERVTECIQRLPHILKLCESIQPDFKVETILLSGKHPDLRAIADVIQQEFDLQIRLANPFTTIHIPEHLNRDNLMHIAPRLLVSCGLALRSDAA